MWKYANMLQITKPKYGHHHSSTLGAVALVTGRSGPVWISNSVKELNTSGGSCSLLFVNFGGTVRALRNRKPQRHVDLRAPGRCQWASVRVLIENAHLVQMIMPREQSLANWCSLFSCRLQLFHRQVLQCCSTLTAVLLSGERRYSRRGRPTNTTRSKRGSITESYFSRVAALAVTNCAFVRFLDIVYRSLVPSKFELLRKGNSTLDAYPYTIFFFLCFDYTKPLSVRRSYTSNHHLCLGKLANGVNLRSCLWCLHGKRSRRLPAGHCRMRCALDRVHRSG